MTVESGPTPVRLSRLPRRGVLLGLSAGQLTASGVAVAVFIAALYVGGPAPLVTAPIWLVAAGAAFFPVGGRPAIEWTPTTGTWLLRRAMHQTSYRRIISNPRQTGRLELPGTGTPLQVLTDAITGAAMVHDPRDRTLTATLEVRHPAFQLQDPAEQQRRVEGFGRVLATVCRSGRIARIQVLERALPDHGAGLADWWDLHGTADDSPTARTYEELIHRAAPTGERHHTTITIALDLGNAARAIRAAGGGLHGARDVLRQEMDTTSAALNAAGLSTDGWYTPMQLATTVRRAYTPDTSGTDAARQVTSAGPVAVEERWETLRSDTAHHAVLWIAEWPRMLAHPGFLAPLIFTSGLQRTTSLTYTPIPVADGRRNIRKRKTEYLADDTHRRRVGRTDDAGIAAEYDDVLQQEADLTAGHGLVHYTGLITLTAADADDLEASIAGLEQAAIQASCETRRLVGQQSQAFLAAALPLARRI